MSKRDGHQPGPQDHAEGAHGSKTHQAFIQQLHSKANSPLTAEPEENEKGHVQHRLAQDRQQHDAAEKKSEKTRLSRDIERGKLEPEAPKAKSG